MRGSASNSSKHPHPDPPPVGQVAFRLLCHVHTAGGVIGNSGSVIKQLETLTGSKIRFEESLPNCHERVINIVGDAAVEKKMSVGGGQEDEMADLSKAQAGLLRVFERVLEVEGNTRNFENEDTERRSNEITVCRLLAQTGKIGALMGKGGKVVDGIRKRSGAKVRVLKEQLPACAGPEEELVQVIFIIAVGVLTCVDSIIVCHFSVSFVVYFCFELRRFLWGGCWLVASLRSSTKS